MDNYDLQHNYQGYRMKYWIKHGLYLPEKMRVIFGTFKNCIFRPGQEDPLAICTPNVIEISPEMKHLYFAVHITLLHEMSHLYIGSSKGWSQKFSAHGSKAFRAEIDRLYALGAFRKLI